MVRMSKPGRRLRRTVRDVRHERKETTMNTVTSKDGTTIAFDRSGQGPALILVGGAFQHRAIDPSTARLAELLSPNFTVYHYDRRGRGDSGDTRAVRGRARDRGHRRPDPGRRRNGIAVRDVVRSGPRARSGGARARGHEAGDVRAAVHRRRQPPTAAGRLPGAAHRVAGEGWARRRGRALHDGRGGRARRGGRTDARHAVLVGARGRGAHAAVRRRDHGRHDVGVSR